MRRLSLLLASIRSLLRGHAALGAAPPLETLRKATYAELKAFFFERYCKQVGLTEPQDIVSSVGAIESWQRHLGREDGDCIAADFNGAFDSHADALARQASASRTWPRGRHLRRDLDHWRACALALSVSRQAEQASTSPSVVPDPSLEPPEPVAEKWPQSAPGVCYVGPAQDEADLRGRRPVLAEEAGEVLVDPPITAIDEDPDDPDGYCEGRRAYRPIDVNCCYHAGHLYYPVQTLVGRHQADAEGRQVFVEQVETVVIRSDATVHTAVLSEAPDDVTKANRVVRLSDGTLIDRLPTANAHGTWEWGSISRFLEGDPDTDSLGALLRQVHGHLRSRVWLPGAADYWLLTLGAALTYVQSIFDAVPLFLLHGPAGTGKSELSGAMAEVSANAALIGQTTPATIIRIIDESGGLVIIDDLESVAAKGGGRGKNAFGEMVQMLKVSYKKSTATKMITDTRLMRPMRMNFYGVKIISNTAGVDDILGSRMLKIHTRRCPPDELERFDGGKALASDELRLLRNRLHTWGFQNARAIRARYLSMYGGRTNREDEIAAPLRVLSAMSEDPEIVSGVERALAQQVNRNADGTDPLEVLRRAAVNVARRGYQRAAITHLALEARRLLDPGYGFAGEDEIPAWTRPEWVGRYLRQAGLLKSGGGSERQRLHGANLRFVELGDDVLKEAGAVADLKAPEDPRAFCGQCTECPYANLSCEIRRHRTPDAGDTTATVLAAHG